MNPAAAWVPGLGPLESAIMTVIWDAGQPLGVREDHARHSRYLHTRAEHAVIALGWPDWARSELGWRADAGR